MEMPSMFQPLSNMTLKMNPSLLRHLASVSPPAEAAELMYVADAIARARPHEVQGNLTSEGVRYPLVYEPPNG